MAPKSGSLLVALMGSKGKTKPDAFPGGGQRDEPESSEEDAGESYKDEEEEDAGSVAFEAFADATGIPDDKRSAAEAALKQFVSACMSE